jgi:glycerophosphoryl diester phosphodiesterase
MATSMIQGHRGFCERYPENTMLGFQMALAEGAGGIETDVRRTRDGVFVLSHDATLDRTTSGSGTIAEMTWPEISRLDASYRGRFGDAFSGRKDCGVPSLDMFLSSFAGHPVFLILHIKALIGPDLEALVDAVVARDMVGQCHFFGPMASINQIKRYHQTCFTLNDGMPGPTEYFSRLQNAVAEGHDGVSVNARCAAGDLRKMAERIQAAAKAVQVSYLSEDYGPGTQALIDAGADFILGNDVAAMLAVFRSSGLRQAVPKQAMGRPALGGRKEL